MRREAQAGLRVEVDPISRLDEVLSALAESGMQSLSYVLLEPADEDAALREAARQAVARARAQADAMATAAGARLGRLIALTGLPDWQSMNAGWMQYGGPTRAQHA